MKLSLRNWEAQTDTGWSAFPRRSCLSCGIYESSVSGERLWSCLGSDIYFLPDSCASYELSLSINGWP